MIQYSILPVYTPEEEVAYNQIEYNGYNVLACKTEQGYVLERIYSTNPSDFLKSDMQPGAILENRLINRIIQ
ncbi:MAG: YlzJ-like family protein [Cellulosilyticaceae bacterium]